MNDDQYGKLMDYLGEMHEEMVTRFDNVDTRLSTMAEEVRQIRIELARIDRRLDVLEADIKDVRGYAKEIDELRARVRAMEDALKQRGFFAA